MRRRRLVLLSVAAAALMIANVALAAPQAGPALVRGLLSGGGGRVVQGDYALTAVIGQALQGTTTVRRYELCVGLLCTANQEVTPPPFLGASVYLPLVVANP